jgi:hypothetical protein
MQHTSQHSNMTCCSLIKEHSCTHTLEAFREVLPRMQQFMHTVTDHTTEVIHRCPARDCACKKKKHQNMSLLGDN